MKTNKFAKLCMMVCLVLGMTVIPFHQPNVQAAEVIATVNGTILSGTTSKLLVLSTKDGRMEIKIDAGTDASACKILLPNKKINVALSHGSDGYLHAVKITDDAQNPTVSIDVSTTATVTGTLGQKTTDELLYLNTAQGEMQIKLDVTTNVSGCAVLVADNTYNVTCARGSDAYMHALSISDTATTPNLNNTGNTGNTTGNNSGNNSTANNNTNAFSGPSVTGTVTEKTKENLLYLSTDGGVMQFVIDSNADTGRGMVATPGTKLTVFFYHGSDAYLHATGIVGTKSGSSSAKVDTSSLSTVSGTVSDKSTQDILYLNTDGGEMQLKLDAVSSLNNCKVLVEGKKLIVTCARGNDAYMHAIDITGA